MLHHHCWGERIQLDAMETREASANGRRRAATARRLAGVRRRPASTRGVDGGFDDYLVKPVTSERLLEALARVSRRASPASDKGIGRTSPHCRRTPGGVNSKMSPSSREPSW
jgi:DNA-binding response OmpR family regulator